MIRPFGLHDIVMMRQLQQRCVSLDRRRAVLYTPHPMRSALVGHLTRHHLGPMTWMYADGALLGRARAFLQVWPGFGATDWTLGDVAPHLGSGDGAERLWREMLGFLVRRAADCGKLRIFARVLEGDEAQRVLYSAGYTITTREELFRLNRPVDTAPCPKGLVPAEAHDGWAISELYRQVVPRHVQEAEASMGQPCATPGGRLLGSGAVSEHVWIVNGRLNAYFAQSEAPHGRWLEVLVRPEFRADIAPHIRYLLSHAHEGRGLPVYCSVADYAIGVGWLLRTLGFESVQRQVQMVMHVAARVPLRRPVLVPGLEGSVDVPTPLVNAEGVRMGAPQERGALLAACGAVCAG